MAHDNRFACGRCSLLKKIQTAEMEVSEMEERKIGQIKEELKAATEAMLPSFIMAYESDERSGVIKLVEQAKKRLQKYNSNNG